MATLRDYGLEPQPTGAAPRVTLRDLGLEQRAAPDIGNFTDEQSANSMGQLRRGWTSGLLGADANAMAADMSSLRAQGRTQEADALSERIAATRQRAATFAPAEQDVTALNWEPGRIVDWGLGMAGQGAASMLEPVGATVGANVAGKVLGFVPHPLAKAAGGALRFAAPAAGGYLNYRQGKGEFVSAAYDDPNTVATKSAQEIENAAMGQGVASMALEHVIQNPIASRLAGRTTLRLGQSTLPRVGADLVGEGATELMQGESKRQLLGYLNPQRDTSGDAAERWNDFAGGAIGAAPFSTASHLAADGFSRLKVKDDTSSDDVSGKKETKNEAFADGVLRHSKKHDDETAALEWEMMLSGKHLGSEDALRAVDEQHAALLKELGGRAEAGDATAKQHLDALGTLTPDNPYTWFEPELRDAARDYIVGDGMDHAKIVEAYRGRRKNEQGHFEPSAPEELAAEILRKDTPEKFTNLGKMADLVDPMDAATDLGHTLASFAAGGQRSKAKLNNAGRIWDAAENLVALYGLPKARALVAKVSTALGAEKSEAFSVLQKRLEGADYAQFREGQRTSRLEAAQQLMTVASPEARLKLTEKGIDVTKPEHQLGLLDYVEEIAKGIGWGYKDPAGKPLDVKPRQYAKLTAVLGAEGAKAALDLVAPGQTEERDDLDQTRRNGGEKGGSEDKSPGMSDDLSQDNEDDTWAIEGARKAMERAPGSKIYVTKGKTGPVSAGSVEGAHPFVPDKKSGRLPHLSKEDDTDSSTGFNTLDAMAERMFNALGGDLFERITSRVQRPVAERDQYGMNRRRIVREDLNPNTDIKNDDPNAKPTLGVGSYRVRRVSAKEVMDDRGVAPNRRVALLRQYLMQEGLAKEDDKSLSRIASLDRAVRELTEKALPQPVPGNPQAVPTAGKGSGEADELRALRNGSMAEFAAKIGVNVAEDASVVDLANAFFSSRFLVTAEQMAEKDQLRLDRAEVLQMVRHGNNLLDKSTDPKNGLPKAEVQADMNLIRFKSSFAIGKSEERRGIAVIPAGDLVAWVFANRNDYRGVEGAKERAIEYRNALMEGIGALAEGGYMDALPFMINAEGKVERFGAKKSPFPPSLKLGGLTQADLNAAAERAKTARAAERERFDSMTPDELAEHEAYVEGKRQQRVARDQDRTEPDRNTDPDHLVDEGRESKPVENVSNASKDYGPVHPEDRLDDRDHAYVPQLGRGQLDLPGTKPAFGTRFWEAPAAAPIEDTQYSRRVQEIDKLENPELDPFTQKPKTKPGRVPGEKERTDTRRSGRYPIAPETVDTRRDNDARTQLDWDMPEQDGGVPTDFTAAQMANAVANAGLTEGETRPLTPSNVIARAPALAREVLWQLDSFDGLVDGKRVKSAVPADPQGAFLRIQRLVAGLSRPVSPKDGSPAGGRLYALPLALILTPRNVEVLVSKAQNKATAPARLERMRDKVAAALLEAKDTDLPLHGRVLAARALLGDDSLTGATMKAPLARMAAREAERVAPEQAREAAKKAEFEAKKAEVQARRSRTVKPADVPAVPAGIAGTPMAAKSEPAAANHEAPLKWLAERLKAGGRDVLKDFLAKASPAQLQTALDAINSVEDSSADHHAVGAPRWKMAAGQIEERIDDLKEAVPKLNAQSSTHVATDAEVAEAKAYLTKVLGPKVVVEFSKDFANAGEWVDAEKIVRLSTTTGPGVLSVAHHEAVHAFWSAYAKNSPEAARVLANTFSTPDMQARLADLLKDEPAALAAITTGPHAAEERVAYGFQFWAAGALDVDKPATTLFAKFRKFLRKVLGMVRESEVALDLMLALHDGKLAEPSAAGRVIDKIMKAETWNADMRRKFDKQFAAMHYAIATANDVLRTETMSATARKLGVLMFTNPGEERVGGQERGYLNARNQVIRQYTNFLYNGMRGEDGVVRGGIKNLSRRDMEAAVKALQLHTPLSEIHYAPVREAVAGVRALTNRYYEYAKDRGLKLDFLDKDHYPRVWSVNALIENNGKDKFIAMLLSKPKYLKIIDGILAEANKGSVQYTRENIAERFHQNLIDKNGVDEAKLDAEMIDKADILTPFFASQKERSLKWVDDADIEPFLEKDLVGAMSRYLHQGIRAAEYAARFGEGGAKLKEMLAIKGEEWINPETDKREARPDHGAIAGEIEASLKAKGVTGAEAQAILARHMEQIKKSVMAHEGSLGKDINPTLRKWSSMAMAYQNLRLLPLSLFAAFGDTVGIAARFGDGGGKMAFEAFTQGLKDVYARWKAAASDIPEERKKSVWENIAEMVGAVDSHMFLEQLGDAHTSEFMTDAARKTNRWLFMANGLTAWDRSMRVSATKSAVLFLQHHADLPDKQHSKRWLAELGLTPGDIPLDANGQLITDRHVLVAEKGIPLDKATAQMERIHYAIVRWVEGAVLTPNAGQRPVWASDPHYAVFFHLKQFTYSFHHTILKRGFNEMRQGNMAPVGALAAAIPTMIAADIVKGLVVGGGSLPAYMQSWDAGDWVIHGAERAGHFGVGQFGLDAMRDPTSVMGPAVEQITDFVWNPTDIAKNTLNAVPGARLVGGLKDMVRAA